LALLEFLDLIGYMALHREIRNHPARYGVLLLLAGAIGWSLSGTISRERTPEEEARIVAFELQSLAQNQYDCALDASLREDLFEWTFSPDGDTVSMAFGMLRERACNRGSSIELLDARGDLLAWHGRSWAQTR